MRVWILYINVYKKKSKSKFFYKNIEHFYIFLQTFKFMKKLIIYLIFTVSIQLELCLSHKYFEFCRKVSPKLLKYVKFLNIFVRF